MSDAVGVCTQLRCGSADHSRAPPLNNLRITLEQASPVERISVAMAMRIKIIHSL
jgi:hypothetical protein